ncbi:MAG: SulP family inorganic anion transporter [Candidatus Dormibacteraeota bacterium]|nr:SulP family inorganic anion transporter [Candidatus Dormibacteraeota bacterium]
MRTVPGYRNLRSYQLPWLRQDLLAGISLSAVMVPAGMGYAQAAGLPPITGLYATVPPLIAYAILGPSRILVVGPDSALVPLIAATVLPLAGGDPARATALAGTLALLTGVICVLGAIGRLGFASDFVSAPVRYGYVNGIALTVIIGQLPKLFGFSVSGNGAVPELTGFVGGLAGGRTVVPALVLGGLALALILACRLWLPRVPGVLVAVVLATLAVGALGLSHELQTVGVIPRGLPQPRLPAPTPADLSRLLSPALAIALVAYTDTAVLSRAFAVRGRYEASPNQELLALGVANAAAGFFQGFPISSSGTRTPVAESTGARTQLAGVTGAAVVVLLLLVGAGLLRNLPTAALAAVVMAAALGLFEVRNVRRLLSADRPEFALSIISFLAVVLLGVLPGIAVSVGLSLLDFIRHAWRPHDAVLGRVDGVKGYHDLARHPDARQIPGLLLFRWDAPLFFANSGLFQQRVRRLVAAGPQVRWLVVAAEPITDVDSTGFDMLEELRIELEGAGIQLAFAEMKGPVKDRVARYGLMKSLGSDFFFPTMGMAVKEYLRRTGVDWQDWEGP